MKYRTMFADHYGVSLFDLGEPPADLSDFGLPDELQRDILAWQDEYEPLLPRGGPDPSAATLARLRALDDEGLRLADRIADAVGDGTKVQYVSGATGSHVLPARTGSWGNA